MQSLLDEIVETVRAQPGFDPATFDPKPYLAKLTPKQVDQLLDNEMAVQHWRKTHQYELTFPADGPLRRELYPKHLEFFSAGKNYTERCFMAANQIGKSTAGSYEATAHMTGRYPDWWDGRVFRKGVRAWVAGDTYTTTRDILQRKLFGGIGQRGKQRWFDGTGMVPIDAITKIVWHTGVTDLADTVHIRHKSGSESRLTLKSYDQGRKVFQGEPVDFVWLDEEAGFDVYGECLVRLITTKGCIILTFTPLKGLTATARSFVLGGNLSGD